ncbi:MAG: hypothetical protein ACYS1A_02920 [Planctomycetota bacterium]
MSEKKVIIGVVGVVVLAVVLIGTITPIAGEKEDGSKAEQNQQEQIEPQNNKMVEMKAARRRMEDRRQQLRRLSRPREDRLMREGFDEWLDEITAAYQEKDMEHVGQLLEEMQQRRQELQERRRVYIERRRKLRSRTEAKVQSGRP